LDGLKELFDEAAVGEQGKKIADMNEAYLQTTSTLNAYHE